MAKKFGVSVGNFHGYDPTTGALVIESTTQMDNSVTSKVSNKAIRAGQGDKLQYIYYYGGDLTLSLTEAQFNLGFIAATMGSEEVIGDNIWTTESVTLGTGGTGVVQFTPLVTPDVTTTIYGWVTNASGVTSQVTFSGKNFTLAGGNSGDLVCVRYFRNDINTHSVTIPANIVPHVIRAVIEIQEGSPDSATGIFGTIQVEIPRLQLDGSLTLNFKSGDVSSLPIKGQALSFNPTGGGCASAEQYAIVREIPNNANWYDTVQYLVSKQDPITLSSTNTTAQLDILAITSDSKSMEAPLESLTFTSATPATATVSSSGLITRVAAGTTIITVSITGKTSVSTDIDVTVS